MATEGRPEATAGHPGHPASQEVQAASGEDQGPGATPPPQASHHASQQAAAHPASHRKLCQPQVKPGAFAQS